MNNIQSAYQKKYNVTLVRRIKGETSGDFERFLISCLGEPI
jgi:annexin A7/11